MFNDTDGSGAQGVGESGLFGIVIEATDGLGWTATTVTDVNGDWRFEYAPTGTLTVEVDEDTVPNGMQWVSGQNVVSFVLNVGDNHTVAPIGYRVPPTSVGTLTGNAFVDTNYNGTRDMGENGLAGVAVTVTQGPYTGTATTDSNGDWSISNVPTGTVYVSGSIAGYARTTPPFPRTVTVVGNTTTPSPYMGWRTSVSYSTLRGTLYRDLDASNSIGGGETGISGVTVVATWNGGANTATTTTDSNGNYSFQIAYNGVVTVDVTTGIPAGMVLTAGSEPVTATAAIDTTVYLPALGYRYPPGSASGLVFQDQNGSGTITSGEAVLAGRKVLAYVAGQAHTNTYLRGSDYTDINGAWSIIGLQPGSYEFVLDTIPGGWHQTTAFPAVATVSMSANVVVPPIGIRAPDLRGSVTGLVFHDINADGVHDVGEPGIQNVDVTLSQGSWSVTVTTNSAGYWQTNNVPSGIVTIDLDGLSVPVGMALTNGVEPFTVSVEGGMTVQSRSLGLRIPPSTTGTVVVTVWRDHASGSNTTDDYDGAVQGGEPYIENAAVVIEREGVTVASGLTDVSGQLSVTVPVGTARITVFPPVGYVSNGVTVREVVVPSGSTVNVTPFGLSSILPGPVLRPLGGWTPTQRARWHDRLSANRVIEMAGTSLASSETYMANGFTGYLGTLVPSAGVLAQSSGAYDPIRRRYFMFGGGQSATSWNGLLGFDVDSGQWALPITPTDPISYPPSMATATYLEDVDAITGGDAVVRPTARRTGGGVVVVPNGAVHMLRRRLWSTNETATGWLQSGNPRPVVPPLDNGFDTGGGSYSLAVWNEASQRIWWITGGPGQYDNIYCTNPVTGTTVSYSLPPNLSHNVNGNLLSIGGNIVYIGRTNASAHSSSDSGYTFNATQAITNTVSSDLLFQAWALSGDASNIDGTSPGDPAVWCEERGLIVRWNGQTGEWFTVDYGARRQTNRAWPGATPAPFSSPGNVVPTNVFNRMWWDGKLVWLWTRATENMRVIKLEN